MEDNVSTYCPSCHKDDRIYKVSAVYSGGIEHGTFSSTDGPVHGTSQTVLSGNLAPLPKPSISCFVYGCSGLFIASGALSVFWLLFSLLSLGNNIDFNELLGLAESLGSVVFSLVVGVGIYLLASLSVKRKMPHWKAAMDAWNRCYYCDRDGIVFDPINETPPAIPVGSFNDYLKKW